MASAGELEVQSVEKQGLLEGQPEALVSSTCFALHSLEARGMERGAKTCSKPKAGGLSWGSGHARRAGEAAKVKAAWP